MNLGQSIRSGVKWLAFGKVGNRILEFAFGIALARLLVPADFGMMVTISIFTGFVSMFTAGGMGQSLIRAKAVDDNDFTAVFTLQLFVGVLVYIGFFLAAPWIAAFFEEPVYRELIRVSALTFLLRPLITMRNAWLTRRMDFRSRTVVGIGTGLFTGVVSLSMALLGMGVWSLVVPGLLAGLFKNFWLARLTTIVARVNLNVTTMRRHAGYGSRIVGAELVNYLRSQSKVLILSKLAGPSLLGIFNKAESQSRIPNQILMSSTMEPLFRAMSKTQDNLDQTKYLFYRAVTLLMAYTLPAYALLWWIAEPFITFIYGHKWIEAGEPMSILSIAGPFLNVALPSSTLLAVRNRLGKDMLATGMNIPVMVGACIIGLQWGVVGVAWGVVLAQAVLAVHLYSYALQALPSRASDLMRAATPGLSLGALQFAVLALVHHFLAPSPQHHPGLYLLVMCVCGGLCAAAAFLWLPLPALRSETERWRRQVAELVKRIRGGRA
jgi:O-antigen/teichoic acid export membrane protein